MKTWIMAFKFFVLMTVLTGVIYPLAMTAFSQTIFSHQANGSMIEGKGSALIAQGFKEPRYFWPRPSAVDYNPMPSGGSNLGPISQDLLGKINERKAQGRSLDLLYASGSGLDPHISPQAALSQIGRVAAARAMPEEALRSMVEKFIEGRQLGFLGEERVNVLLLNLALDERR